jgi:hypothetical protein
MEKDNTLNYWFCKIGPIERHEIPHGGDFPLRSAVEKEFMNMFGEKAVVCSSGWGLTGEMRTRLDIISLLPITNPDLLKEIDKLLKTRNK